MLAETLGDIQLDMHRKEGKRCLWRHGEIFSYRYASQGRKEMLVETSGDIQLDMHRKEGKRCLQRHREIFS